MAKGLGDEFQGHRNGTILRRKRDGLCIRCGNGPNDGETQTCTNCRAKLNSYAATERTAIMQHYGGKCVCCGESEEDFLTIDHINNNGADHRRELGPRNNGGVHFYKAMRKLGYPDYLQILCWNCNSAKGMRGICPHERNRQQ